MAQHYGGMGGIWGGRPLNDLDEFELAVDRVLGPAIRADRNVGVALWSALANVDWVRADGATASYSFRAAGDLIAAIVGQGEDYMDYYCSAPYATVAEWIAEAMAKEGWHAVPEEITPLLPKEGP